MRFVFVEENQVLIETLKLKKPALSESTSTLDALNFHQSDVNTFTRDAGKITHTSG